MNPKFLAAITINSLSIDFFCNGSFLYSSSVISYPKFIEPGYLSNLTNMSGIKIVIKHIMKISMNGHFVEQKI